MSCDYGGHELFPKPGYWRLNENSTNFLLCPLKEACLGGENADYKSLEFYSGKCKIGYEGPLCNLCSDDYGKLDKNSCGKCNSNIYLILAGVKLLLGISSSIYSLYLGTSFVIFFKYEIYFSQFKFASMIILN